MAELKWWLVCLGIKASNPWNKEKLVSRYTTIRSCLKLLAIKERLKYHYMHLNYYYYYYLLHLLADKIDCTSKFLLVCCLSIGANRLLIFTSIFGIAVQKMERTNSSMGFTTSGSSSKICSHCESFAGLVGNR